MFLNVSLTSKGKRGIKSCVSPINHQDKKIQIITRPELLPCAVLSPPVIFLIFLAAKFAAGKNYNFSGDNFLLENSLKPLFFQPYALKSQFPAEKQA